MVTIWIGANSYTKEVPDASEAMFSDSFKLRVIKHSINILKLFSTIFSVQKCFFRGRYSSFIFKKIIYLFKYLPVQEYLQLLYPYFYSVGFYLLLHHNFRIIKLPSRKIYMKISLIFKPSHGWNSYLTHLWFSIHIQEYNQMVQILLK